MSIDFSKLQFLPIDIPNPPNVLSVLDSISYDQMIVNKYRTCHHIPIMTRDGKWSDIALLMPELIEWCEKYLFTWAKKSRIMIITTQANNNNAPHIDCSPKKFKTWQHKFRFVFRGNVDSLYFISKTGKKYVPKINKPYIISGKWPHGMFNTFNKTKYTFALGAPWEPEADDLEYMKVLNRSYKKYKKYYLSFEDEILPDNYESLYERKYLE